MLIALPPCRSCERTPSVERIINRGWRRPRCTCVQPPRKPVAGGPPSIYNAYLTDTMDARHGGESHPCSAPEIKQVNRAISTEQEVQDRVLSARAQNGELNDVAALIDRLRTNIASVLLGKPDA